MLTLLRKVRKSLIHSGSARKYLLYSIGEIALVVIGILIALQINNWNVERINRESEEAYLKALKLDVVTNLDQYDYYKKLVNLKVNVLTRILNGTYDSLAYVDIGGMRRTYDIFFTRYKHNLSIQHNTFQELLSSGGISLIESQKLRKGIFDYYTVLEDRITASASNNDNWPNKLSSMIPGEMFETDIDGYDGGFIELEGRHQLVQGLKDDLDIIRPLLNTEIQFSGRAFRNLIGLETAAKNLLILLDEELAKN